MPTLAFLQCLNSGMRSRGQEMTILFLYDNDEIRVITVLRNEHELFHEHEIVHIKISKMTTRI